MRVQHYAISFRAFNSTIEYRIYKNQSNPIAYLKYHGNMLR